MENAPDMELLPAKLNEQSVLKERKGGEGVIQSSQC